MPPLELIVPDHVPHDMPRYMLVNWAVPEAWVVDVNAPVLDHCPFSRKSTSNENVLPVMRAR